MAKLKKGTLCYRRGVTATHLFENINHAVNHLIQNQPEGVKRKLEATSDLLSTISNLSPKKALPKIKRLSRKIPRLKEEVSIVYRKAKVPMGGPAGRGELRRKLELARGEVLRIMGSLARDCDKL